MPYFDYDGDIHVDVDDFLNACDKHHIHEIIEALIEDGHLPKSVLGKIDVNGSSVSEYEYEKALETLKGKWNRLSPEDEETILKIAKKF